MNISVIERMVAVMARLLSNEEVVAHGTGSLLPSLAILLARRMHAPNLTHLSLGGGINASPTTLPTSSHSAAWMAGSPTILNNVDFYTLAMGGLVDTMFLGAGQIDAHGQINSSVIGNFIRPKVRLPGGGGAAILAQVCKRIIVWRTQHTSRIFVSKLDFVTSTGNVDRVVTPLGVFKKHEQRLVLEGIYSHTSLSEIEANTEFEIVLDKEFKIIAEPSHAELVALETLDPDHVRELEMN